MLVKTLMHKHVGIVQHKKAKNKIFSPCNLERGGVLRIKVLLVWSFHCLVGFLMETLEGSELCVPQLNSSCKKPKHSQTTIMLIYVLLSAISLITVALNLLVIISISHFRHLQCFKICLCVYEYKKSIELSCVSCLNIFVITVLV